MKLYGDIGTRRITQACNMAASEKGVMDRLKKLKLEIVQLIERQNLPCIVEIENKTVSVKILEGRGTSTGYRTGGWKQSRIRRREKGAAARFAEFHCTTIINGSDKDFDKASIKKPEADNEEIKTESAMAFNKNGAIMEEKI